MIEAAAPVFLVVFLFGIAVGSFLNVCILRIPAGESVVAVPSHCMSCGKRLHWFEMVPILSYLFLRGRCSACKSRISPQYPLIEAANGVLWCLAFSRFGLAPDFLLASLLCSALLMLSVVDARTREIPPGANVFLFVLGALRALLHFSDWKLYAIGLFAVSVPLLLVYLLSKGRAIGGGDIKLMAACGLFLGWKQIVFAFFLACVLGTLVHLPLMALKKAGRELAMGPYLSAGVFIVLCGATPFSAGIGRSFEPELISKKLHRIKRAEHMGVARWPRRPRKIFSRRIGT